MCVSGGPTTGAKPRNAARRRCSRLDLSARAYDVMSCFNIIFFFSPRKPRLLDTTTPRVNPPVVAVAAAQVQRFNRNNNNYGPNDFPS